MKAAPICLHLYEMMSRMVLGKWRVMLVGHYLMKSEKLSLSESVEAWCGRRGVAGGALSDRNSSNPSASKPASAATPAPSAPPHAPDHKTRK